MHFNGLKELTYRPQYMVLEKRDHARSIVCFGVGDAGRGTEATPQSLSRLGLFDCFSTCWPSGFSLLLNNWFPGATITYPASGHWRGPSYGLQARTNKRGGTVWWSTPCECLWWARQSTMNNYDVMANYSKVGDTGNAVLFQSVY